MWSLDIMLCKAALESRESGSPDSEEQFASKKTACCWLWSSIYNIYIYMIIYVYIRTIKHLKVRLPHSFSVGDCKWSQRFRVSIPKCTRPSWGAIVNRCTSQMRDHAVTHPTLIPWSSSIRSYRRVLYKACDVEGFRKEVVLFKDLSQQLF